MLVSCELPEPSSFGSAAKIVEKVTEAAIETPTGIDETSVLKNIDTPFGDIEEKTPGVIPHLETKYNVKIPNLKLANISPAV